jgi:hypothetical protein
MSPVGLGLPLNVAVGMKLVLGMFSRFFLVLLLVNLVS